MQSARKYQIQFFGHACFVVKSAGITIVFDPHDGKCMGIPSPENLDGFESNNADIILCSHSHYDHNSGISLFSKQDSLILEEKEGISQYKGVEIIGIKVRHGEWREWGYTIIYVIKFPDNFIVIHGGDMGFIPNSDELNLIMSFGRPDIIILPIGGKYSIDSSEAIETAELLNPKITTIMCHFLYGNLFNLDDFEGMTDQGPFLNKMGDKTLIIGENKIDSSLEKNFKKFLIFEP